MDGPIQVPVDNPHEDTEWNDILRKHGVIPEKPPSPTPILEEAAVQALQKAHEQRLEDKQLDELNELEDEEDEEFLNQYRKKRLEQLSFIAKTAVYGQVYHLQKPDYARDVTEASKSAYVLVHLASSMSNDGESRLLTSIWQDLAVTFSNIKFCEIQGDMCIEGYPEKNCPTILVYHDGDIVKQMVTLKELNGPRTAQEDLEGLLLGLGALTSRDPRLARSDKHSNNASSQPRGQDDDDDDD